MLSVLIPVFNRNIVPLIKGLGKQLEREAIPFEIICLDDSSSPSIVEQNNEIEKIDGVSYKKNLANLGRIKSRQRLAEMAKFDWLLFLDADVELRHSNFIKRYLETSSTNLYQAIFGGFSYKKSVPKLSYRLRWKYGSRKEEVSAKKRNKNPYKIIISANYMIKKDVFNTIYGHIFAKGYGYDNYFGALLKEKNIKILHIDNEVWHLGIERSEDYLKKKESAAQALLELEEASKIKQHSNSLLYVFQILKKLGLRRAVGFIYKKFHIRMRNNLLGKNPSITLFQLYSISYMCYMSNKPCK